MPSTLAGPARAEQLIRKSRFIGCVQPVADRAEALAVVAALRAEHPGAAHVCWALMAGGQSAAVDDGEPSGTAGRPMLEVLRHQDLDGVLATVVRYFGGVKLGATRVPRQTVVHRACTLPYALEGWLRRQLDAHGATLDAVDHGDQVRVRFSLPEAALPALRHALDEGGRGLLTWAADAD